MKPTLIHASREKTGRKPGVEGEWDRCAAISGVGQCRNLIIDNDGGAVEWVEGVNDVDYLWLCPKHARGW